MPSDGSIWFWPSVIVWSRPNSIWKCFYVFCCTVGLRWFNRGWKVPQTVSLSIPQESHSLTVILRGRLYCDWCQNLKYPTEWCVQSFFSMYTVWTSGFLNEVLNRVMTLNPCQMTSPAQTCIWQQLTWDLQGLHVSCTELSTCDLTSLCDVFLPQDWQFFSSNYRHNKKSNAILQCPSLVLMKYISKSKCFYSY